MSENRYIHRNSQYTNMFKAVRGTPTRANSRNVMVSPLFSAFCMMITLLAAPRIDRFPAMVQG